jgi:parallel beta-helix repeat protein
MIRALLALPLCLALTAAAETVRIEPGPEVQFELQEALILAEPGQVIELAEGVYEMTMGLSLDVDGVTIRGAGMDKTILSFKEQDAGSEGLLITSDNVTLEDFAVEDTRGDAIKSNGADTITFRRVRTEWTNGPDANNGPYGLYPVQSSNVLIEECVAIGASDAGIYVGQSKGVIVRNSRAEYNVAGIEIENCHGADVYGNVATNNTGGILVFDLPDIPVQDGHNVRVFNNQVFENNTDNFAPEGNIVGEVPRGTGIMIMANRNVEVFDNDINDHDSTAIMIVSYLVTQRPVNDPNYNPYPSAIHIHSNRIGAYGTNPDLGELAETLLAGDYPAIFWDGIVNPALLVDGELPAEHRIVIQDNEGDVTFANLNLGEAVAAGLDPSMVKRDISAHAGELPRLAPITLAQLEEGSE